MTNPLYQALAAKVDARLTCSKVGNDEWFKNHTDAIRELVRDHLPRGSGFDAGTHLDLGTSTGDKLVLSTSFHHMNDGGFYDGWTEHSVIVVPSLIHGFNLKVTGRNRRDIKSYIAETFDVALRTDLGPPQFQLAAAQ